MTHYKLTIWQNAQGRDHASWSDLHVTSRTSALRKLARAIIALDGVQDLPVQAFSRAGQLRFTSPSIFALAGWDLVEGPDRPLAKVRYRVALTGWGRAQPPSNTAPEAAAP